jgi:hypothetical protein
MRPDRPRRPRALVGIVCVPPPVAAPRSLRVATSARQRAVSDNLTGGAPRPFYELDTTAASGTAPGAAPAAVIVMNPYVAAVRFVLAGRDLEQNVKQTAGKIAADVAARASAASAPR